MHDGLLFSLQLHSNKTDMGLIGVEKKKMQTGLSSPGKFQSQTGPARAAG
jgi:hypothetical protein